MYANDMEVVRKTGCKNKESLRAYLVRLHAKQRLSRESKVQVHILVFLDRCKRLQFVGRKRAIKVMFTFKGHCFDLFLLI